MFLTFVAWLLMYDEFPRFSPSDVTLSEDVPSNGRRFKHIMLKWFVKKQIEAFGCRWGRGHGQACRRVRAGGETVAMQHPQVA
jgi:hypothetical protein